MDPPWGGEVETAAWIMEIWMDLKRDPLSKDGAQRGAGKTDEKMMEYPAKVIIRNRRFHAQLPRRGGKGGRVCVLRGS